MASKYGGVAVQPTQSRFGGIAVAPEDPGVIDRLTGAADIIGSTVYGAGKEIVEGISGLGGLAMGKTAGEASTAAQALTEQLPSYDLGEDAQELIRTLSEKYQAAPELIKEIGSAFMTLGPSLGESAFQATGSPLVASLAGAAPGALEAATGLRAPKAIAGAIPEEAIQAITEAPQAAAEIFTKQSPAKQRIGEMIKSGSTDIDTARFRLSEKGKTIKDQPAVNAINQGFDEAIIADVKASGKDDQIAFRKMVDTMERGKKSARVSATERPSDILGNTLMNRVRVIQGANKAAGKQLDTVAKGLKDQTVDSAPAVENFLGELSDMGITLDNKFKPNFKGSDIEGAAGPENVISRIINRMKGEGTPDAYDLHRLKKYIDEQVTFGKNAEGLAGKAESVLKNLRRNLDQTLDTNFPEYDRINTAYSETIGALDAIQDVAGKKMNLTGRNAEKATGTLMRRILSNAQSRVTLLDATNQIEAAAKKYERFKTKLDPRLIEGPAESKIKGDLLSQILFVDELDSVFGPTARTSFQGQIKQATQGLAEAKVSPASVAIKAGATAIEKVKGVNEKNQFKAIKALLRELRK